MALLARFCRSHFRLYFARGLIFNLFGQLCCFDRSFLFLNLNTARLHSTFANYTHKVYDFLLVNRPHLKPLLYRAFDAVT